MGGWSGASASPSDTSTITSEPNLLTSRPRLRGRVLRAGSCAILKCGLPHPNGPISVHLRARVDAHHPHPNVLCAARFLTTSRPPPSSDTSNTASNQFAGVIFSAGQPSDLLQRLTRLSEWKLSPSNKGISRQYTFPTFASAWHFMSIVADECKSKRHHPSWHNLYSLVTIEWTTHEPEGLSIKDVEMAEFCDRTADTIGLKNHGVRTF